MCREEATSAFLATLLDQSDEFRKRFFQLCGIPPFVVKEVVVEQAKRDITIAGERIFTIVENKIDSGSKAEGQLLGYFRRVKEEKAGAQVHCVYLAPNRQLGESEVRQINSDAGEVAIAIAWSDLQLLCKALGDFDNEFAESGIDCVLEAIRRRQLRPGREWDDDELMLREILRSVMVTLQPKLPHRKLTTYACQLWSTAAITVMVDLKVSERELGVPENRLVRKIQLQPFVSTSR